MSLVREYARRHLPHGRTLPEPEWQRRHRGILMLLWVLATVLPIYGIARGHAETHSLASAIALPTIAWLARGEESPASSPRD